MVKMEEGGSQAFSSSSPLHGGGKEGDGGKELLRHLLKDKTSPATTPTGLAPPARRQLSTDSIQSEEEEGPGSYGNMVSRGGIIFYTEIMNVMYSKFCHPPLPHPTYPLHSVLLVPHKLSFTYTLPSPPLCSSPVFLIMFSLSSFALSLLFSLHHLISFPPCSCFLSSFSPSILLPSSPLHPPPHLLQVMDSPDHNLLEASGKKKIQRYKRLPRPERDRGPPKCKKRRREEEKTLHSSSSDPLMTQLRQVDWTLTVSLPVCPIYSPSWNDSF